MFDAFYSSSSLVTCTRRLQTCSAFEAKLLAVYIRVLTLYSMSRTTTYSTRPMHALDLISTCFDLLWSRTTSPRQIEILPEIYNFGLEFPTCRTNPVKIRLLQQIHILQKCRRVCFVCRIPTEKNFACSRNRRAHRCIVFAVLFLASFVLMHC